MNKTELLRKLNELNPVKKIKEHINKIQKKNDEQLLSEMNSNLILFAKKIGEKSVKSLNIKIIAVLATALSNHLAYEEEKVLNRLTEVMKMNNYNHQHQKILKDLAKSKIKTIAKLLETIAINEIKTIGIQEGLTNNIIEIAISYTKIAIATSCDGLWTNVSTLTLITINLREMQRKLEQNVLLKKEIEGREEKRRQERIEREEKKKNKEEEKRIKEQVIKREEKEKQREEKKRIKKEKLEIIKQEMAKRKDQEKERQEIAKRKKIEQREKEKERLLKETKEREQRAKEEKERIERELKEKEIKRKAEEERIEQERERKEEEEEEEEERILAEYNNMLERNKDLVEKFLTIAERKVSVIDDYGDENWEILPDEILICLKKFALRENDNIDWQGIKKGKRYLPNKYKWLQDKLNNTFRKYYKEQQSKKSTISELHNMSGIEFESWIVKLLKENGFSNVTGTPTTGDQGADIIAKKNGKTIIIQAKRYNSTVGNKAVQEVISAIQYYSGDEGWVITNSTFTSSAKQLAQKAKIKLIDGKSLARIEDFIVEEELQSMLLTRQ